MMRVWVSDGIHTARDTSDRSFVVPNHPPMVEIVTPREDVVRIAGQAVAFEAVAYDPDLGAMEGKQIAWRSDLDGLLGYGAELALSSLSVGEHRVTVLADDGAGGVSADSVGVAVYESAETLPRLPDELTVSPSHITIDPWAEIGVGTFFLYNRTGLESIRWTASTSVPWLHLERMSGHTPDSVMVGADRAGKAGGEHRATVTFTNANDTRQRVDVEVVLRVQPRQACLPLVVK
jgi:hypothetical protein